MFPCTAGVDLFPCCVDIHDIVSTQDENAMPVQLDGLFRCDRRNGKRNLSIPFARYSGRPGAEKVPACGAMKQSMYIGPDGYVLPCMSMAGSGLQTAFPNAFTTPMKEILTDSVYCTACRMRMGQVVQANDRCRECRYRDICGGGCRALGYMDGKKAEGIDEDCCRFFQDGWYERINSLLETLDSQETTK